MTAVATRSRALSIVRPPRLNVPVAGSSTVPSSATWTVVGKGAFRASCEAIDTANTSPEQIRPGEVSSSVPAKESTAIGVAARGA